MTMIIQPVTKTYLSSLDGHSPCYSTTTTTTTANTQALKEHLYEV